MPASLSHTHNLCENVTLGDGSSQNRSKFSKFLKNWRKLQLIMMWVKFHPALSPSSPPSIALTPSRPSSGPTGVTYKVW
jgi:hypothetical protein